MPRRLPVATGSPRHVAYLLMAGLFVLTAWHGLGFPLLAGLFSYTVLDLLHRRLARVMHAVTARWLTLLVFVVTAGAAGLAAFAFLRETVATVPVIISNVIPRLTALATQYGVTLPFGNLDEFRAIVLQSLRDNAGSITRASSLLTTRFFSIVIAVFVAVLCFMAPGEAAGRGSLYDMLAAEVAGRVRRFMTSFERVLSAQVLISAINTTFTAIFLLALEFPYATFLIPATFIVGLLPVVGNLISNTLIVGAGLMISPRHALLACAFLVAIHKGEYILNSRIIGASIRAPMWQTLLGILVGDILLGIPGIILAPAVLHYLRIELQDLPAPRTARP